MFIAIKDFGVIVNGPAEEVKCEDLEKIVVDDDLEKFFFRSELN